MRPSHIALLFAALALAVAFARPGTTAERLCTPLPCKHKATALPPAPDGRRCYLLAVTHGGQTKDEAVANAQRAMKEMLPRWGRLNGVRLARATAQAMAPQPFPYYRTEVTPDLRIKPDIVTERSHTVCWRGITLPVGCTAGIKICG